MRETSTTIGGGPVHTITAEDLAREAFLHGMRGADLARLATGARAAEFPAGRRIIAESEPAERFWLVRDGSVALDLRVPERGPVVVDTLGPGAALGWSWLFRPYRWRFGATALTDVRAIEFDGRLIRTLCAVDPSLGYELTRRFTELIADRLQAAQLRLLDNPEPAPQP
ncbi:cyclic nucleotide-binding domain-containing protein [Actinomadura monticuli]|uniref:Cyclic nucleotide-binding domain-containing protein n=1 Tax=Actinomadura monticuli TaxID=3097367 RepID=A0ABV4QKF2_9ACTN